MKTEYEYLLKPGRIGRLELKNRLIFSASETLYASVNGEVTQRIIDYYVRRAEGGAALTLIHSTQACTRIDPIDPYPGSLRIDDDAYIPMFAELTEKIHEAGAKAAILVSAGGGAQSRGHPYDHGLEGVVDYENVGATEKHSAVTKRRVRRLSVDEIETLVRVYGYAARRAKTAGFDAFFIHAWAGYLVSQFLSPHFNTRDDKYGGDFDRRLRLLTEIVEACRKNVGPDFPIVARLSIDEGIPDGIHVEDSVKIAKRLEETGVDAIDACAGTFESVHMVIPPLYMPKGCLVDLAATVKREIKIPVINQGRLYDPDLAEEMLRQGKVDFIGLVRGMLADPYWANKVGNGQASEIRKCITCNHCISRVLNNLPIRCAVNPATGREGEFEEIPPIAPKSKKVVIIGAGPGGMETATIAAQRGHKVKLFERTSELGGGQLKLAAKPPCRGEILNIIDYHKSQITKLSNLEVVLNKEVTADEVVEENPDVVVLATGSSQLVPVEIEGIDRSNVVTAHDVLAGKAEVRGKVVIVGGGLIGAEMADQLSENGMDVTIVKRRFEGEIAEDEERITRLSLLARLQQKRVNIVNGFKFEKIAEDGVIASDRDGNKKAIPADYVVIALGSIPYNPIEQELRTRFKNYYVIGDAKEPRKIMDAILEGFLTGYRI